MTTPLASTCSRRPLFFLLFVLLNISPSLIYAQTIRCKATGINSPSFHPKEMNLVNKGDRIKIKFYEQYGLVKFDVRKLKGHLIKEAFLTIRPIGKPKFNFNKGTDIGWLSVTTVSENWDPNKASANKSGYRNDWGWPGAKTYDVACGNGNTLRHNGQLKKSGKTHRIKLAPKIIHALITNASYGLFLMDGAGSPGLNPRIQRPTLVVITNGTDQSAPTKPSGLKLTPAPNWATAKAGAIWVTLKAPKDAFSYNIQLNGKPIQRWQIPFATPGKIQTFPILDLPPSSPITLAVVAVDSAGNQSGVAESEGKSSPALTVPKLPAPSFSPKAGNPLKLGNASIYGFPELVKINPITKLALHEPTPDLSQKNAVWDGASGSIKLISARAEIISFQLAIEGAITNIQLTVSDLNTKSKKVISSKGVRLWRNWYVKNHTAYALPFTGSISCPMPDNKIEGQTHQAITIDYHIPRETSKGIYRGTVTLKSAEKELKIPLLVKVYNAVIPDELFFNPEMNCYSGPGEAGSNQFNNSMKLAHYHRSTINRVPYSQSGNTHKDWTPDVNQSGKVTNWSRFDKNLGPLLDGSLFANNPRKNVPVSTLYLPFYEGWPVNFKKHYNPGRGIPKGSRKDNSILKNRILAGPIEQAMGQGIRSAWKNCLTDFVQHAKEKGWNKTALECYLNNKPKSGFACWTLDEPCIYRDWEALNFFGKLWKDGINDPAVYTASWQRDYFEKGLHKMNRAGPTFLFRGDISRPNWQGTLSDQLMNIMYIGGGGFDKFRMMQNHKHRMPSILYAYGSCPPNTKSHFATSAWCLKAFANECDGVLPWQSLGKGLTNTDPKGMGNALIVDGGEYGNAIASIRVHAFRRGAQDCELLRLLMLKKGWSRQHIGLLVSQKVPLNAEYKQAFSDEAAALKFGKLTSQGFVEMKEGVLKLLAGKR